MAAVDVMPRGITLAEVGTAKPTPPAAAVDLCPVCGASGWESCAEEDGQFVLDHWGRPVAWVETAASA